MISRITRLLPVLLPLALGACASAKVEVPALVLVYMLVRAWRVGMLGVLAGVVLLGIGQYWSLARCEHSDKLGCQVGWCRVVWTSQCSAGVSDGCAQAMAAAGTVAVLLPGAFVCLRETKVPPIDSLRAHGVAMAVATDCNPGTSPLLSLRVALACWLMQRLLLSVGDRFGAEDRTVVELCDAADGSGNGIVYLRDLHLAGRAHHLVCGVDGPNQASHRDRVGAKCAA